MARLARAFASLGTPAAGVIGEPGNQTPQSRLFLAARFLLAGAHLCAPSCTAMLRITGRAQVRSLEILPPLDHDSESVP